MSSDANGTIKGWKSTPTGTTYCVDICRYVCPCCKSTDIDFEEEIIGDCSIRDTYCCDSCHSRFSYVYVLGGVEIVSDKFNKED